MTYQEGDSKVVVVTGASAGVGRATVREFAKSGAKIGLLARGVERLDAAAAEVRAQGGVALAIPTDVAHPDQVESAAERIERELGPIDVWVNNAMVTVFAPFAEVSPEEFRRVTEVTYLGTVYGTMSALKRMLARDRGCIVQVGSALAYRSIPLQSAYCGAKHGIVGFTDSIRTELIHAGSRVWITAVHLPAMNTPQFDWCRTHMPRQPQPVPPIYEPEVAARAIVSASRDRRREVLVGGPTVLAVEGTKLAPGIADRYLADTGFDSQMTLEPIAPDRKDNLFEPVSGNYAAHGRFHADGKRINNTAWTSASPARTALAAITGLGLATFLAARFTHKR
jgi:NAD(P)-dependent dehydrogenase (short-subunit alcohol dehydrogenase family)